VPQLDDLERALEDRALVAGGDGGGVVGGVEDQDQAAVEARPHQVDGLLAAGTREVDDDGVDGLGGHGRPGVDVAELGDPAGAVQERSQGQAQRGIASQQHDMAGHLGNPTWRRR
jgi:hypothetical protein